MRCTSHIGDLRILCLRPTGILNFTPAANHLGTAELSADL